MIYFIYIIALTSGAGMPHKARMPHTIHTHGYFSEMPAVISAEILYRYRAFSMRFSALLRCALTSRYYVAQQQSARRFAPLIARARAIGIFHARYAALFPALCRIRTIAMPPLRRDICRSALPPFNSRSFRRAALRCTRRARRSRATTPTAARRFAHRRRTHVSSRRHLDCRPARAGGEILRARCPRRFARRSAHGQG